VTIPGASTVSLGAIGATLTTAATGANKTITTADTNAIVELLGVSSVSGFGGLQTDSSITTTTIANNIAPALSNTGSGAAVIESAAGYSYLNGTSTGTLGTTSTVINNLAPSAKLDLTGLATDIKSVTVNHSGVAGSNALDVTLVAAETAGNLTVNGEWLTQFTGGAGGSVLTSFVDGTNTLSTLKVAGSNAVTLSKITSTSLATIDVSSDTGAVTLGSATTPVSNSNLKVLLETSGSAAQTVFTGGDGVSFTEASSSSFVMRLSG
jgi:hypothetical protein